MNWARSTPLYALQFADPWITGDCGARQDKFMIETIWLGKYNLRGQSTSLGSQHFAANDWPIDAELWSFIRETGVFAYIGVHEWGWVEKVGGDSTRFVVGTPLSAIVSGSIRKVKTSPPISTKTLQTIKSKKEHWPRRNINHRNWGFLDSSRIRNI